tara:strand:- start:7 stop:249 length:243 start_codon:yes stop_codon:yes gene_type:complete
MRYILAVLLLVLIPASPWADEKEKITSKLSKKDADILINAVEDGIVSMQEIVTKKGRYKWEQLLKLAKEENVNKADRPEV